jgi:hypothetical protein
LEALLFLRSIEEVWGSKEPWLAFNEVYYEEISTGNPVALGIPAVSLGEGAFLLSRSDYRPGVLF